MESSAIPAAFLQNCISIVVVFCFAMIIRIRWLISLLAWGATIATSFLWKNIGGEWLTAWKVYFEKPIIEGGLWKGEITETEIIGLLIFCLLPLGLAYITSLALIAKRMD